MSQIPRDHAGSLIIPRSARGYGSDEFLFFEWDPSTNPQSFRVLVEDLAGRWIELSSSLQQSVFVPNVYFPEHAQLVVVGLNRQGKQVRHLNELRRGHRYRILSSSAGDHMMSRSIPQDRLQ